jgi:16S rRNA (guanine527-N7)-methyltransferase
MLVTMKRNGPRPSSRQARPTPRPGRPASKIPEGQAQGDATPLPGKPILNKRGRPTARPKPQPFGSGVPKLRAPKPNRTGAAGGSNSTHAAVRRPAPKPHDAPTPLPDLAPLAPSAEFLSLATDLGIEFEPGDVERLGHYLALLLEINKTTNLTGIEEPAVAWKRHVFDSLTLIPALADLPDKAKVIDVGSGGGLPGIPLAICMAHLSFTLLEATGKKAEFLRQVAKRLGLANVTVVEERAETIAHDRGDKISSGGQTFREGGHRETYDAVVARAVGRLPTLLELTVPFAKVGVGEGGGRVLLIKGQQADEELAEAKEAMHLLKVVHANTLDTPTGRIVAIEKPSATPKNYPRSNGEPKRVPLGMEKK